MVNIKINGVPMQAAEGSTVLEAARANGIKIPTLCYLKDVNAIGACRVCLVEIKGARALAAACVMPECAFFWRTATTTPFPHGWRLCSGRTTSLFSGRTPKATRLKKTARS